MIEKLINLADYLDKKGLAKEADYLDAMIRRMAGEEAKQTNFDEGSAPKATATITPNMLDSSGEYHIDPGYPKGVKVDHVIKITLSNEAGKLGVVSARSDGGMGMPVKEVMDKLQKLLKENGLKKSDVKLKLDTDQINAKNAAVPHLTPEVTKGYLHDTF